MATPAYRTEIGPLLHSHTHILSYIMVAPGYGMETSSLLHSHTHIFTHFMVTPAYRMESKLSSHSLTYSAQHQQSFYDAHSLLTSPKILIRVTFLKRPSPSSPLWKNYTSWASHLCFPSPQRSFRSLGVKLLHPGLLRFCLIWVHVNNCVPTAFLLYDGGVEEGAVG